MEGKEKRLQDKDQPIKTWRPSKEIDGRVSELAEMTGASYNSTVCLLVHLGLQQLINR